MQGVVFLYFLDSVVTGLVPVITLNLSEKSNVPRFFASLRMTLGKVFVK